MKEQIFFLMPHFLQNILISIYNFSEYKNRYGIHYEYFKQKFKENKNLSENELLAIQKERYTRFINHAVKNSLFYKNLYKNIENPEDILNITKLPVLGKETVRNNVQSIFTIPSSKGIISETGGTTGKSLKVYFTYSNMQERFAFLDTFRGSVGYKLGKKTAWFSGKNLLTKRDVKKNRFWKTDHLYNARYYSTFHIKQGYLKYYIENLIKFEPEYISGYPTSIAEIAKYGLKHNIIFPQKTVKGVFTTSEMVSVEMRDNIELFFKTKLYNQYSASEGAPLIFECKNNKLHLELQSGVFEVLNENNAPVKKGKLVVTTFTTEGTPLIRYDIGDSIELSEETCTCGNNNPLVKEILGRIDDYVYSPENGKINLVNIANAIKDVKGIVKMQITQNTLEEIHLKVIIDKNIYNENTENIFLNNWRKRLGSKMKINIKYVADIPSEESGKFRIIKNNIKHLID